MIGQNNLRATGYRALADFRYQIRRFLHFSEEAARHAGLEPQHHQLMLAIKGAPENVEPRIGYLAERLQIHHHSAVELVDRLASRGLIQRFRGEEDRREVHVKLTAKGERLLKELTLHHRDELRTAAPALAYTLNKMMTAGRVNHKAGRNRIVAARTRSSRSR
jgi:DNA-binding MarR family transcriptional regulator